MNTDKSYDMAEIIGLFEISSCGLPVDLLTRVSEGLSEKNVDPPRLGYLLEQIGIVADALTLVFDTLNGWYRHTEGIVDLESIVIDLDDAVKEFEFLQSPLSGKGAELPKPIIDQGVSHSAELREMSKRVQEITDYWNDLLLEMEDALWDSDTFVDAMMYHDGAEVRKFCANLKHPDAKQKLERAIALYDSAVPWLEEVQRDFIIPFFDEDLALEDLSDVDNSIRQAELRIEEEQRRLERLKRIKGKTED